MSLNGVVRIPGNLDPSAQEFRPAFPAHHHHFPFFSHPPPPPQLPPPPPPPPFFYPPHQAVTSSYVTPSLSPSPTFLPPSIPPPASSPTRALLLTAVPTDVSESLVRRELEIFGDVRAVQMGRVSEGILTVHYYDLRAAHAALDSVREQHMQHQNRLRIHYSSVLAPNSSYGLPVGLEALAGPPPPPPLAPGLIAGRPVWAQFTVPATHAFPDGQNQGTLVIFNLNPNVSALTLNEIFQPFGAVKELRETPMKRQQRFVEFYDVRDASRALAEMNGKEINGRSVMIEFSRPGGHSNKKFNHHHPHPHFNTNTYNNNTNNHSHSNPKFHHHHNSKPLTQPPPLSLRHRRTSAPRQSIRRRRSSPSSDESLEAVLGGLALHPHGDQTEGNKNNNKNNNGNGNGNCSSSGSSPSPTPSKKQHQQRSKLKPWRGKHKNFDPRFLIKENDATVEGSGSCKDTRTTVMIKNIPNKYSQKLLLNMLDNHCIHCNHQQIAPAAVSGDDDDHQHNQPLSSYDFVYLPIDFNNKCNVGYGFVNMTSPEATLRLYKSFHHQNWEVFNSRKICEVTYARVQGLEALKEHFKNSKFACENDEYLPVVFSPPRDGSHLTDPLPIVFSNTASPFTADQTYDSTDVGGSDLSSTIITTTTAATSTLATSMDGGDLIIRNPTTILEGDNNNNNGGGGGVPTNNSRSPNDGADVIDDDDDDGCSSNSSMGCSVGD